MSSLHVLLAKAAAQIKSETYWAEVRPSTENAVVGQIIATRGKTFTRNFANPRAQTRHATHNWR